MFLFYAMPASSEPAERWAAVIRDSLPTAVADIRDVAPNAKFYAVLPSETPGDRFRDFSEYLSTVENLQVVRVNELDREFASAPVL